MRGGGGGGGGGNSRVIAQVPPPAGRCVIIGTMRAESMHARDENIYVRKAFMHYADNCSCHITYRVSLISNSSVNALIAFNVERSRQTTCIFKLHGNALKGIDSDLC